jgi:hypothetical protein
VFLKSTLRLHEARFHFDEVLVIDTLKREFRNPLVVYENVGAQSEQAIYDIQVGGHRYLQVNTKDRWLKPRIVVSFYGVDAMPKGRELWKRKS